MKVAVTAKDIADGVRQDGERCPVALALRRQTGHYWEVWATTCWDTTLDIPYLTPAAVRRFLLDFDAGRPVAPLRFELVA